MLGEVEGQRDSKRELEGVGLRTHIAGKAPEVVPDTEEASEERKELQRKQRLVALIAETVYKHMSRQKCCYCYL